LDEGVLNHEAKYALTQLRLSSKLPSLHIPLPHGRGKQCLSSLFPGAGRVQTIVQDCSGPCPSAGNG